MPDKPVNLSGMSRIETTFTQLKNQNKSALVTYIMAGDPDPATSARLLDGLALQGADIIELGMPFTDPMADGPTIQAANLRALTEGMNLHKILDMVRDFRTRNHETPLVLMGYFNPIYIYGCEKFARDAGEAGVDGLLLVDLPPEEDGEIKNHLKENGIDLIRLITPTSTGERLKTLTKDASGFLYYVSIAGVTGTASINIADVVPRLQDIHKTTNLPVAVGFGIRTREDARQVAAIADGVVIGSAFVTIVEKTIKEQCVNEVLREVSGYKAALS
ncbi:MAG: tryptophan synthase subunit alpha [Pseudobdellovibrionaceae bacterium]